jgi:hypothetical protein
MASNTTNISDLPYNAVAPNISPPSQAATKLPERDIPRETIQHVADPQAHVQYLPPKPPDYIPPPPPASRLEYSKLLEEFRIPILLALLFFVFQMQSFQELLKRLIPAMFTEGQLTSNGAMMKSALFGAAYYAMTLAIEHLSRG